jgi:CheY-like chemotaxis protein
MVQQQPIQLLLSNIMMLKMNDLELAGRIKVDYPLVKVQLISCFAYSSMVSDEESKAWFEQRLAKPVPMTTLLQRVSL